MTARVSTLIPNLFQEIYVYREFLKQSVARDLKTKYKRSALGYFWTMLHPLLMMAVLAVVFSSIMRMNIDDYAIFLFCGLLPWNFFNSTVMMTLNSIKANHRIFEQIAAPKYIFVLSTTFSNLFNLILAVIPLIYLVLIFGRSLYMTFFAFPMILFPLVCTTIGVSLLLSACNVFFDDTLHLTEVGISALYFLCPILYHRDLLPPELVKFLVLNPLFGQMEFFREIFYHGRLPAADIYCYNLAGSALILLFGLWVFRRSEDKFFYFV